MRTLIAASVVALSLLKWSSSPNDPQRRFGTRHKYSPPISTPSPINAETVQANQTSGKRPLTPTDLFSLEELGNMAISPDGQWLAYTLKRSKVKATLHMQYLLLGNGRADIWLVPTKSGIARNITNGTIDDSGYWHPVWSPDGERLAMLSTKGGNVRLWMWERASGRLRPLTDRGVETSNVEPVWISNRHLLCPVLPERKKSRAMVAEIESAQVAIREWPKAWRGLETTSNVVESGAPNLLDKQPQGELRLIDVEKESHKVIATGNIVSLRLSPTKRHVAFLKRVDFRIDPNRMLRALGWWEGEHQLVVADIPAAQVWEITKVINVDPELIRWSNDGKEIALIGRAQGDVRSRARAFRIEPAKRSVEDVTGDELEPTDVAWSGTNQLIVLLRPRSGPGRNKLRSSSDWWVVESQGRYRNLTESIPAAPNHLLPEADGNSFVGVAEGDVWRIRADGAPPSNLTEELRPEIASIVWPDTRIAKTGGVKQLIVDVHGKARPDLYKVDLSSGHVSGIQKPAPEALLAGYGPQGEMVFEENDRTGTYLWVSRLRRPGYRLVVETNIFLRKIAQGEFKKIEYRGLDRQNLNAWVILPVGYQQVKRYPLITYVYAGWIVRDLPTNLSSINSAHSLNLQLLTARGYAVLIPSMPLKGLGEPSDPYMELTKGVLPAVDEAIDLGIADPKRLGLMGHSYGGYSTYGLITQTNRFEAAIALAGISDLISLYGQFDARFRYNDTHFPRANVQMMHSEGGQNRMGQPPWKDPARYIRNSPLFHVERVETPLMIIQGDMDYVGIQQGEEFFSALYRQNKRAAFVRYWGEGHILQGPPNIRDLWHRIFAWFDEYLDISRDSQGNLVWDGERIKSRRGSPPLKAEDFARFDKMSLKDQK